MKAEEQRDRVLVDEMLQHLQVVAEVAGSGKVTLGSSAQTRYALEHAIELFAEAAEKVSNNCKGANERVPWSSFRTFRRALAHPYDAGSSRVGIDELWVFATQVAPRVRRQLTTLKFPRQTAR